MDEGGGGYVWYVYVYVCVVAWDRILFDNLAHKRVVKVEQIIT
jgi:hypothetical protein